MQCENCGSECAEQTEVSASDFTKNRLQRNEGTLQICELCFRSFTRREEALAKILQSAHNKKLIVAGPGTGKTYTFRRVLENLPEGCRAVVFTLINNLADDLRGLQLIGGRDVNTFTFHGYCKNLFYQAAGGAGDFAYTFALQALVEDDARLLGLEFDIPFDQAFAELIENDASLIFFLRRADYYNAVGFIDSVFRTFTRFRDRPQTIPEYALVIADEYQDFNRLEAEFINLLATRSPVLLAGDDDQALYGFRYASDEFIRGIFGDDGYEKFTLPLCSRCPSVLTDATQGFIAAAVAAGWLEGRIPKEFACYWPDKYTEHAKYPTITHVHCTTRDAAHALVENELRRLYASEQEEIDGSTDISFLIVGPNSRHQLKALHTYLQERLAEQFELDLSEKASLELEEGYALLRKNPRDNLGWRLVLLLDPLNEDELRAVLQRTHETNEPLVDLLPEHYKERHLAQVAQEQPDQQAAGNPEVKPKVKFVTFLGSKGLSARHVLVVGMNNYDIPRDPAAVDDAEVCQLIVALTRARHSCTLISNGMYVAKKGILHRPSRFIQMIPRELRRSVRVGMRKGKLVRV
jgi:superfamily I DNA/RNA helicase